MKLYIVRVGSNIANQSLQQWLIIGRSFLKKKETYKILEKIERDYCYRNQHLEIFTQTECLEKHLDISPECELFYKLTEEHQKLFEKKEV